MSIHPKESALKLPLGPHSFHILVDGQIVYLATDEQKFVSEAAKYASVSNATFVVPKGA